MGPRKAVVLLRQSGPANPSPALRSQVDPSQSNSYMCLAWGKPGRRWDTEKVRHSAQGTG